MNINLNLNLGSVTESLRESDLQHLIDRAERLEYIIRGSQLVEQNVDTCGRLESHDLTARINALSVKLRALPSNAKIGKFRPLHHIPISLKTLIVQ
jgi:hypothetical protein